MKSLLFFEFRCRIRLRRLQYLPDDRDKGDKPGEQHGHHENPPIAFQPVNEIFQVFLGRINSYRNADDAGDANEHHIVPDGSPGFGIYRAAEDLPDGDVAGFLIGIIRTHGHQPEQGDQDGQQHEEFHHPHVVPGRLVRIGKIAQSRRLNFRKSACP